MDAPGSNSASGLVIFKNPVYICFAGRLRPPRAAPALTFKYIDFITGNAGGTRYFPRFFVSLSKTVIMLTKKLAEELSHRIFELQNALNKSIDCYEPETKNDVLVWHKWLDLYRKMNELLEKFDEKNGVSVTAFAGEDDDYFVRTLLGKKD